MLLRSSFLTPPFLLIHPLPSLLPPLLHLLSLLQLALLHAPPPLLLQLLLLLQYLLGQTRHLQHLYLHKIHFEIH